jgi:cation-transporting P-type ATPase 13A2
LNRCGWGSGALYFAEIFPNSKITAFSNSRTQKLYIDEKARAKRLRNVEVITGNVVDYEFEKESFDRVVSIEVSVTGYRVGDVMFLIKL